MSESEEKNRGRSPSKVKNGDHITSKLKTRSVSLTRSDSRRKLSPPKKPTSPKKLTPPVKKISSPSKRKRKSPPESSPKLSVKERKTRFEAVQDKYRTQRCLKESREKSKLKRDKKPKNVPEESDDSIASLLKTISADIKSMKSDLKDINQKIDSINSKIIDLEVNVEKAERLNKKQFDVINSNVARLESTVTDRVIETIDPQIKSLKNELRNDLKEDLKAIVDEELASRFPSIPPSG